MATSPDNPTPPGVSADTGGAPLVSPPVISPLKFFDSAPREASSKLSDSDPHMQPRLAAQRDIKRAMRIPEFDAESAAAVLAALASGQRITHIGADPMFPPYWVINRWRSEYPEFDELCAEATRAFADRAVYEVVEVADNIDEHPASRSVRIDARLKAAKLLHAKKYGDRKVVAGDPDAPLLPPTTEGLDARIAALLEGGVDSGADTNTDED